MPDGLHIDEMAENDISAVVKLISDSMNPDEGAWAEKTIEFHFFCRKNGQDDGRNYLLARIDGKVVGITGLHRYLWGPEDTVWLGWFAVSPEYQGQKIGFHLMNHVISLSKKAGYRQLLVETYSNADFEKARKFYERYGFNIVGEINNYIKDGVDMVVFGMRL